MIDIKEIEKEIEMLEKKDTSYGTCEKLAVLYTVKDHYMPPQETSVSMPNMSNNIMSPLTMR